ncbi:MAG: glycosyltransferase family 4 protein [Thermoleophilaceae bacterium]
MRILFVSHYALPHLGGIEVAIDAMARELTGRGHEVAYLASDAVRVDERIGPVAEPPYRVVRIPATNVVEERLGVPYPVFGPRLFRALRRELARADVVHAHGFLYMNAVAALRMARGPSVLTEHVGHVEYDSRLLDRAEALAIASLGRAAVRAADALVYVNDSVGAELRRLAPGKRIERIENGVDTDRYRPPEPGERERLRAELGWTGERKHVLFVGRLVAKKGLPLALDAARHGGFELVVAGPGTLPADAPPNVTALGALPPQRVAELYRAADAFLLPSRGEGFPLTVQEAMASGLPVVLLDDPGYRSSLAGAGAAATLVAPDGERLARAIESLAPAAGAAAAEHARRAFSWHAAADAHERLYAELLRTSCMAR